METKIIEGLTATVVTDKGETVELEAGASFTLEAPKTEPEGDTWLDQKMADIANGEVEGTRLFSDLFNIVNCMHAEAVTSLREWNDQECRDGAIAALDRAFQGAFSDEIRALNVSDVDAAAARKEAVAYDRKS